MAALSLVNWWADLCLWRARGAALGLAVLLAGLGVAAGCTEQPPQPGLERVVIKGSRFWLEPALDDPTRIKGLGGRASIAPEGGMVFVFPKPQLLEFVMRDCTIDIDIAFLDDAGRVTAVHEMKAETPRQPGESDISYNNRLKRYSSQFTARFAVEVAAGTLKRLDLKAQDLVVLDTEGLKRRAK